MADEFHAEASRRLTEKLRQHGTWEAVARDMRTRLGGLPRAMDGERLGLLANLEEHTQLPWEQATCLLKYLFGMFTVTPALRLLRQQGASLRLLTSTRQSPVTSRWDAEAMSIAAGRLPQALPQFLPLLDRDSFARESLGWNREPWYRGWSDGRQISRLALGSPKACHGAEVVLADIFGVRPFAPAEASAATPVAFLWAEEDLKDSVPSSFARAIGTQCSPKPLASGWRPRGLAVRRLDRDAPWEEFRITREPGPDVDRGTEYALVAARRDEAGTISAACAGVSGPATCAAARLLSEFGFPPDCPLIYGVVRAQVVFPAGAGDRELDAYEVVWRSWE